jgi:glycosyltransferase involved in cell wall biosynthesis
VVNEILELERQGLDVTILSLRRPDDGLFHESVCRVRARAHYLPETAVGLLRNRRTTYWKLLRRSTPSLLRAVRCVLRHRGAMWLDLFRAVASLRWARKQRIDHVHVHFGTEEASVALLANTLGGLSYSLTLHAFDIFRDNVDRRLLARKINASRFTVTVSEFNRRYLIDNFPGVDEGKIRVNYNGVDLQRFTSRVRQRNEDLVLGVGRLVEKKGFIHLVRAIDLLRDQGVPVHCKIVGEGREQKRLQQEIERLRLGAHVELTGALQQERVRDLMHEAACFALPCVSARNGDVDALPTVLLEALACECPTISTKLSGVPEIIEDQASGLLVEPGNDRALASAIRRILTDRSLAAQLGQNGRRRAEEKFSIRRNVAVMHRWLRTKATKPRVQSKPLQVVREVITDGAPERRTVDVRVPDQRSCRVGEV